MQKRQVLFLKKNANSFGGPNTNLSDYVRGNLSNKAE